MTSHIQPSDHDAMGPADSAAAESPPLIRLMCSFGGRILPRPLDDQLRYVGGDTRIVAVHRNCTFAALLSKLAKFASTADIVIKYQLPNEDLDALISVTTDEDVENMMDEYDRLLAHGSSANARTPRLRLFLFPSDGSGAFGSVLSGTGSSKHEHWFLDALNGRPLERGRSEASSILSEVPDYLFGLDNNSEEPIRLPKTNVSASDPGSPAHVVSSPHYGSASSTLSIPAMQSAVEPEVNQGGYAPQQVWQYVQEPVPVYYVQGPVQGGSLPVPMQMPQYVQTVPHVARGQLPVGYRPMYVGAPPVGRAVVAGAYDYQMGAGAGAEAYEVPAGGGLMRSNTAAVPLYRPAMGAGADAYEVPPGGGLMRSNTAAVPLYRPAMGAASGTGQSPALGGADPRIARGSL